MLNAEWRLRPERPFDKLRVVPSNVEGRGDGVKPAVLNVGRGPDRGPRPMTTEN